VVPGGTVTDCHNSVVAGQFGHHWIPSIQGVLVVPSVAIPLPSNMLTHPDHHGPCGQDGGGKFDQFAEFVFHEVSPLTKVYHGPDSLHCGGGVTVSIAKLGLSRAFLGAVDIASVTAFAASTRPVSASVSRSKSSGPGLVPWT